jgi:hypothetical protein
LEKLRSQKRFFHLYSLLILSSSSTSGISASKSPPKAKRTPSTSGPAHTPTPPSSVPVVQTWNSGLDPTSSELNHNPFSDATAFTDIWADLFEFNSTTVAPDLTLDMSYDPSLSQQFFVPNQEFSLDPEIPSIETQRTLFFPPFL